jgi:hypothetical protein
MADLKRLSASLTGLKEIVEADKETNTVNEDEHQARLEQELEQIRQVNDVTEGVIESLKVTELNLDVRVVPFFFNLFIFFFVVLVFFLWFDFFYINCLFTFRLY